MAEGTPETPTPGKKGKISADDQLKFLLSCLRFSVSGKIDFTEVATECKIVTKGAAAKRYERLLKAHDIQPQSNPSPRDASVASTKVKKATTTTPTSKAAAAKKRKLIEAESTPNNDDDDEEPSPLSKKKKMKKEIQAEVKEEEPSLSDAVSTGMPQHDGASDMVILKTEPVVKTEMGAVVKEERVAEADRVFMVKEEELPLQMGY
ncbi:MAG: hypothetical protein Q9170_008168, partial [Blastenia crenularia]